MNDYGHGHDLTGKMLVYPRKRVYGSTDDERTRTFMVQGGPGALGSKNADGSFDGTKRHVTGYWICDDAKETIDTGRSEYYLTATGKKVYQIQDEYTEVEAVPDPVLLESKSNKPRGRAAWKPQEPETLNPPALAGHVPRVTPAETAVMDKPKTTAVMVVGDVMSSVVAAAIANNKGQMVSVDIETHMPGPPDDCKPVIAVAIETPEPPKGLTPQHVADILRMYGEGKKIADIAEHCGDRNKANRIRKVLAETGLK